MRIIVLEMGNAVAQDGSQEGPKQPAWVGYAIPCQSQRRFQRSREPRADIVFTVGCHRRADRDNQRLSACVSHPCQKVSDLLILPGELALEPNVAGRLRELFQATERGPAADRCT